MWKGEIGPLIEIIRNKETSSSIALGAMILVAHSDFTPPLSSLNDGIIRQNVILALTSAQGADEALTFLIRATSNPSTEDRVASSRINEDSLTSLVQVCFSRSISYSNLLINLLFRAGFDTARVAAPQTRNTPSSLPAPIHPYFPGG